MNKYTKFMEDVLTQAKSDNTTISSVLKHTFENNNLLMCFIDMLSYDLNDIYQNDPENPDRVDLENILAAFKAYNNGSECDESGNYRKWCKDIVNNQQLDGNNYLDSISPNNFEGFGYFKVHYDESGVLRNNSNSVMHIALNPTIYLDKYTPINLIVYILQEIYKMMEENNNVVEGRIILDKIAILTQFMDGKYDINERVSVSIYTDTASMKDFKMNYYNDAKREMRFENNSYIFNCSER